MSYLGCRIQRLACRGNLRSPLRTVVPVLLMLAVGCVFLVFPATAQQSSDTGAKLKSMQREIDSLKRGQEEILKRLEALQSRGSRRGRKRPPFRGADISIKNAPSKGRSEARIAIIEFSDYQCPFCRRFSRNTLPRLLRDYVQSGKLRYVFRDFPLESIHPAATGAAIAARCAGAQGKYWRMHDRFFQDPKSVAARNWRGHAKALSLDLADFDACMADDSHAAEIRESISEGRRLGISGTPTFFLGTISADGTSVKATEKIIGAKPYKTFKRVVDRLLKL